jgi:hypothetical protein
MQHFMTILAQGCDLYSALLQKVDPISGIPRHENPFSAPVFRCSDHCVEAMQCRLTHQVQQL